MQFNKGRKGRDSSGAGNSVRWSSGGENGRER